MATISSASLATPAHDAYGRVKVATELRSFWREFFIRAFNPYRPELYYMRGPGPAWRAKHSAVSPAVQSLVSEIRAAKSVNQPA